MPSTIIAPYARSAVIVDEAGNVLAAKNVTAVKKLGTGHYNVTVGNDIDTTIAAIQATIVRGAPSWYATVHIGTDPSNNNHIVDVWTGANGAASDQPFHLAVL
ncbi:hypothetical protein [Streptomyces auratus]|uniref:Uncharacterized protein n=1 Tax=Streptomyces auratus AGR0001 TaxID=1160718 RepID=A0A8B1NYZ2_9ACTN|nr:hypothetical protein [Streptomyces auratus]QTZ95756.1 hypothetical protein SU9_033430 [Streptomyces auratus AGR0001]